MGKTEEFKVERLGDRAILLTWQGPSDRDRLGRILRFKSFLAEKGIGDERQSGSTSLTIHYRDALIEEIPKLKQWKAWYEQSRTFAIPEARTWHLPVCYAPPFAQDLEAIAHSLGLTPQKVIELHAGAEYTAYGYGFLPGFLYLGGLPEALHHPRKDHPELEVPKGSVGIGGDQTGVYPQRSPGGWHLIGRCPIPLFRPKENHPTFIRPGDRVRFRPVDNKTYLRLQSEDRWENLEGETAE